jgi:nucleotide-binding universal stress UspA family protein
MSLNVLVPTDFSEASAATYRYAQRLGKILDAKITLLHVFHPAYDLDNPYMEAPVEAFGKIKREKLDAFAHEQALLLQNEQIAGVKVAREVLEGFAGEVIVKQSNRYDLIVIGAAGAGNFLEQIFGSVSTYVAQRALCPVLLVPDSIKFKGVERIMYASNYEAADEALMRKLLEKLGLHPQVVFFVHVDPDGKGECRVASVDYQLLSRKNNDPIELRYVQLAGGNVLEALRNFAKEKDVDLIVMGAVQRGFLERVFHRSLTKQMIFHSELPLLIAHFDA